MFRARTLIGVSIAVSATGASLLGGPVIASRGVNACNETEMELDADI